MSKQTYYIVQVWRDIFVRKDEAGYGVGYGMDKAARLSLGEARRLYRKCADKRDEDTPRRFPRIIKVTVETKTITNPND